MTAALLVASLLAVSEPWLSLEAGIASVGRGFSYNDPITTNLRSYEILAMPVPVVRAGLRPVALFDSESPLATLGIHAAYGRSIGVTSSRDGGPDVGTTYQHASADLAYRLALGSAFAIAPRLGLSSTHFALDGEPDLPDVTYLGPRLGTDLEFVLGDRVAFFGGFAFVFVVNGAGEAISDDYFQRGSVNGLTAELGLRTRLASQLALRFSAAYQQYFFAFDPEPGDRFVAGGALDQLLALEVTVVFEI